VQTEETTRAGETLVSARDLSVEYPSDAATARTLAVRGVTLELAEQEVLCLLGDSGSGKSTLAAAVAGVADTGGEASPRICGGALTVLGVEVRNLRRTARARLTGAVGYLAQDGGDRLNGGLTVAENVAEPIYLRDRRFDPGVAGQAVATLVDAVHLPLSVLRKLPHELSAGQRQRVALARALILEPRLLVADEPIQGVDVTVRGNVIELLRSTRSERPFAALVVTSELSVVRELATRVAVLHQGLLVGVGPLDSLVASPEHPYLKALAEVIRRDRPVEEAAAASA
jgi:peptide/nickel transport system ATP-binding protein